MCTRPRLLGESILQVRNLLWLKQWKRRLFYTDAWVKKIGSGGATSVPPDSFLIGPDLYSSQPS